MQTILFGREQKPGVKKYTDYYLVRKKTGNFLVQKNSDRTKIVEEIHRNAGNLILSPTNTDVEYKNIENNFLPVVNKKEVINKINDILLNGINPTAVKSNGFVAAVSTQIATVPPNFPNPQNTNMQQYILKSGTVISGTTTEIMKICKLLKEDFSLINLSGYDPTKFHFSTSKNELVEIEKMDSIYIMNALIKKQKQNLNNIKVTKNLTISDFLKLYKKDEEVLALENELGRRNSPYYQK